MTNNSLLLIRRSESWSERSNNGLVSSSSHWVEISSLSKHIIPLDFVEDGFLLSEHLKHNWHHEHECEAGSVPKQLECKFLDDVPDHVTLVDESVQEIGVIFDKFVFASHFFLFSTLTSSCHQSWPEVNMMSLNNFRFIGVLTLLRPRQSDLRLCLLLLLPIYRL